MTRPAAAASHGSPSSPPSSPLPGVSASIPSLADPRSGYSVDSFRVGSVFSGSGGSLDLGLGSYRENENV
jgi:hypothetical protein